MTLTQVFKVRSVFTGLPGGPALTTTYFRTSGSSPQGAADQMRAFWNFLAPTITAGAAIQIADEVLTIETATGNIIASDATTTAVVNSSGAGDALSRGTSGLLNLNTGVYFNGRQVRGKLYVPQPAEGANTLGLPSAAYKTALENAWAALIAVSGSGPAVYSPTAGDAWPISSVTPSNYWARLRSRQR